VAGFFILGDEWETWPHSFTSAAFCLVGTAAYENATATNAAAGPAVITIIRSATLLRWHRAGFQSY
jgi:hypothetical protein